MEDRNLYSQYFMTRALLVVLIAAIAQFNAGGMVFTGDEPRYIYQSLSVFFNGALSMPFDEWAQKAQSWGLVPLGPADFAMTQSPLHTIVLAPVVGTVGPIVARYAVVIVSVAGLVASIFLVRSLGWSALAAGAVTWITFPVVGYSASLYPEIWFAAAFALAWYLANQNYSKWQLFAFLCAALVLPFIHLRASFIAAGLVVIAALNLWRQGKVGQIGIAVAVSFVSALLFAYFQYAVSGSVAGTASAPYAPSLTSFPIRLGVHLLGLRHGLLVYSPIMICALCGLIVGLLSGDRLARQGVFLFFLGSLALVWGTASESLPARFWTGLAPIMVVGLGVWFHAEKPVASWIVTALLGLVSLYITFIYVLDPVFMLSDRQSSLVYDRLAWLFYLPSHLPWDAFYDDQSTHAVHWPRSIGLLKPLALFATAIVICLGVSAFRRTQREVRSAASIMALAILLGGSAATRLPIAVTPQVTPFNDESGSGIEVALPRPMQVSVIRFDHTLPHWFSSQYPDTFRVLAQDRAGVYRHVGVVLAKHITTLPAMGQVGSFRLIPEGAAAENPAWRSGPITVRARR